MINFYRKIRQKLVAENKFSKYLLYAIGEIFLVIIGILIAVNINNRNIENQQLQEANKYLTNIVKEIDSNIQISKYGVSNDSALIDDHKRILTILKSTNVDSIEVLKKLIGSTATMWTMSFSFPTTDEFMKSNLISNLESDKIKTNFINFSYAIERIKVLNDNGIRQYQSEIEPFFISNVNYSNTAHKVYDGKYIQGGPRTNFEKLFNNLEFWNIVTFKLEQLIAQSEYAKRFIEFLEQHRNDIQLYLENNSPNGG